MISRYFLSNFIFISANNRCIHFECHLIPQQQKRIIIHVWHMRSLSRTLSWMQFPCEEVLDCISDDYAHLISHIVFAQAKNIKDETTTTKLQEKNFNFVWNQLYLLAQHVSLCNSREKCNFNGISSSFKHLRIQQEKFPFFPPLLLVLVLIT